MNATSTPTAKRKYTPRKKTPRTCDWCEAVYESCVTNSRFCSTKCKERNRHRVHGESRRGAIRAYRSANPDRVKAQAAAWRKANPEKSSAHNRTQYLKNRDARIAYASEYQRAKPWVAAQTRYRRKSSARFEVTDKDLNRLLARHGNSCSYCHVALAEWGRSSPDSLQWDHVLPLSRGGRHSIGNILPSCRTCNTSKSAKLLAAWKLKK